MGSETILPCPFCGGDCNAEQDGWDDDPWQVSCVGRDGAHHCGYRAHYGADKASAVAAHNAVAAAVRDHAAVIAERDRAKIWLHRAAVTLHRVGALVEDGVPWDAADALIAICDEAGIVAYWQPHPRGAEVIIRAAPSPPSDGAAAPGVSGIYGRDYSTLRAVVAERDALRDQVGQLREACQAAVFVARKVGASSLHRPKWADERDALYMIDATLAATEPTPEATDGDS